MDNEIQTFIADANSKIDNFNNEFKKLQADYQEKLQKEFKIIINAFFEHNPKIYAIVWTQFTPWWNDGEPCEFNVHDKTPMTKKLYDEYLNSGSYDGYEFNILKRDYDADRANKYLTTTYVSADENVSLAEAKLAEEYVRLLKKIPESVYLAMFGDHALVTITKNGSKVDEFEHD